MKSLRLPACCFAIRGVPDNITTGADALLIFNAPVNNTPQQFSLNMPGGFSTNSNR